jgi:hypothetical protein
MHRNTVTCGSSGRRLTYLSVLTDLTISDEAREAMWAELALICAADAVAELRRLVEFYLSDGPDLPGDLDPPPEPRFRWDD